MLPGRALFCWYAQEDLPLRAALDPHLVQLRREGFVETIDEDLHWADVVLVLVSKAFLASAESCGEAMDRLLARHHAGFARVIAVLVQDVDCGGTRFEDLPLFPLDAHARPAPVSAWDDRDQALASVARGIRAAFLGPLVRADRRLPTAGLRAERRWRP